MLGRPQEARCQPTKQHYFAGFAPILETIVYQRIPTIRPQELNNFSDLPIEKYGPQRKDLRPILVNLTAKEIEPCQWCADEVPADMSGENVYDQPSFVPPLVQHQPSPDASSSLSI
ncbi:hypothetical protein P8452_41749 [Trifolium repens]|nr:hypothetical protein P8452_41749 [Trifolium repens]